MLKQKFTNKIVLITNANIHIHIYYKKYRNKKKYPNRDTSVLPLNQLNLFLDAEFRRVFQWNK